MAISLYHGLQGHGKTYGVVEHVVLKEIARGRTIWTNVAGIKLDKVIEYLERHNRLTAEIGTIKEFDASDVAKVNFFPRLLSDGKTVDESFESIIKGGDVIIIDEVWRFWPTGSKIPPHHQSFFREHRKHSNLEKGWTCDIVLITQVVGDLHRDLKAVVESNYLCKKLKELGMTNHYLVQAYSTYHTTSRYAIGSAGRYKFNSEIFALYSSYSSTSANELDGDDRQNYFKSKSLWMSLGSVCVLAAIGSFYLWKFFHPKNPNKPVAVEAVNDLKNSDKKNSVVDQKNKTTETNTTLKVEGFYLSKSGFVYLVRSSSGDVRFVEQPSDYLMTKYNLNVLVDGVMVTNHPELFQKKQGLMP